MQVQKNNEAVRFIVTFLILFLAFYYFNIFFFGLTLPGSHYSAFLANNLNYIDGVRWLLIKSAAFIIDLLGYTVVSNKYQILVAGKGFLQVVYTCLGLGVISFFAAFVIAYPKQLKLKIIFLICGVFGIQTLNVIRLVLLALFWDRRKNQIIDHHTIFNIFIYVVIMISLYFWVTSKKNNKIHAAN